MSRYINPFTDTGFKIIFGTENQSEVILKGFLNELFRDQPNFEEIREVRFINNERTRDNQKGKTIIHDVICTTEHGHRFIVEMQKENKDDFLYRSLYYLCRAVTDQIRIASSDKGIKGFRFLPVVGVFICDFNIRELDKEVVNHYMFNNTKSGRPLSSSLRSCYIQLPQFNKRWEECDTKFEQWLFILKNMYTLNEFPPLTRKDEVFARLEEVASYSALSEEDRIAYEADLRWVSEYEEEMRTAKRIAAEEGMAKGLEEGKAIGLAEGRAEGKIQGRAEGRAEGERLQALKTAEFLLKENMPLELIAKATSLSIEEIKKEFGV